MRYFELERAHIDYIEESTNINTRSYRIKDPKFKEYAIQEMSVKRNWEAFKDGYDGEILVDIDNNVLIGTVFVGDKKDKGFINSLWVNPKYRRLGFATILMNDAITKMKGIDLTVSRSNKSAINLYKKLGFVIIVDIIVDGNGKSEYWMKLRSKLTKDDKVVNESYDDIMTESYVINEKDIYYNKDKFDSNDWSYIMETEEPNEINELETFLESTGSCILRDSIYPYIETTFKTNPANVRKFNSLVGQFIDRNIDKLTTSGPVYLIPFTDKDKSNYYELFNIEESHIKKIMKEHTAKLNASKFKLLNQNPIFALFYFVIRYFTLHPDKKSLNSALTIYALSAYPSIFSKYFPNGVIEPVMQYTIDNLTDKFLIKKTGHILGLLVESIQHSYDFLKSPMREATDAEVIRFIQRIRNDHNSIFKKIANVYMDNYRNNRGVILTNTNYDDDTPIIDEVDNATTEVSNAINKVLLPIVQNGVDIVRAEAAAKMAGISVSDCRMFLNNIINDKNTDLLQKFIESLLFLYIYEDHRTVRDVRSQYFLRWAASLFKKTNSKNKNILQINEVLNIWAENSGIYAKFHREASRINYKKAIFFYVVLSVQKYIG